MLDGPYKGRKLFDRLNLVNANPVTVEIAQRTLSAICHATGRMQVQDSEELHLIPFIADVQVLAAEERLRRKQQGALPAAQMAGQASSRRNRRAPRRRRSPSPPAPAFTLAPWKRQA